MSSLHHKMNNYEVIPPEHIWDKVAAALDESESANSFPDKLYNIELSPPAAAWENISASLTPGGSGVVPMQKRRTSFLRYAAAAVLIGFAAFAVIWWTSGTTGSDPDTPGIVSSKNTILPENKDNAIPGKTIAPGKNDLPIPEDKNRIARLEQPVRARTARNNSRVVTAASYSYDLPLNDQYTNPLYAYEDHIPDMTDRYIVLMTPDGNIIRMSKKWSNLVCCVSGEEQDADCKSQLKKWQEKLASSPLAPSPGNFMDILSLVNSLDEAATEL